MSRPTSDLLDFFGRKSGGGARAVSKPVASERPRSGVKHPRTIGLLTAILIAALTFVGGYLVGRARRASPPSPELARPATPEKPTWILRGRPLPRIGIGGETLESKALAAMRSRRPELAPFVSAVPVEGANGRSSLTLFRLVVRGFKSEAEGLAWARILSDERVDSYPLFAECRPEPAPR